MANTTWDPNKKGTAATLSNENQTATIANTNTCAVLATNGHSTGKWYFEELFSIAGTTYPRGIIGIGNASTPLNAIPSQSSYIRAYFADGGLKCPTLESYGSGFGDGAVISVAVNLDDFTITFYLNGASQGVAYTDLAALGTVYPFFCNSQTYSTTVCTLRTTTAQFSYSPPKGYFAWDDFPASSVMSFF